MLGKKLATVEAKNSETEPDWSGQIIRLPVGDGYDPSVPVHIGIDNRGKIAVYVERVGCAAVPAMPAPHRQPPCTSTHLGRLTLTLADFERGFAERWFPLHQGSGEVQLSGVINDFKRRQREQQVFLAAQAAAAQTAARHEAQRVLASQRQLNVEGASLHATASDPHVRQKHTALPHTGYGAQH